MSWLVANIRYIMIVSGGLTLTMVYAAVAHGKRFLAYQVGIAVLIDLVWVVVFAAYLLAARRMPVADLKFRGAA